MKKNFNILIIIGLVLGIIGGLIIPNIMNNLSFIGTIFINLLKFMIVPIIFTSLFVTIYKNHNHKEKIALKSVITFIIMFVISFLITYGVISIIKPGVGLAFEGSIWDGEITKFSISDILTNLFPSNLATLIQNNMIFPTIIFSIICAIASKKINDGQNIYDLMNSLKNMLFEVLKYIMYLTPLAVFSLMGTTIANYGTKIIGYGAKYIGCAYLCSILVLILVMIIPVWIICKINPITYIKKVAKIWLITITTCSSAATLPTTIKTCNEDFNIPEKITNVVVPLGCTIHMCGGAVSFALLGLFCSELFGIEMSFTTFLLMLVSSTLINMAAPGIPNGGIVIGATYLSLLGIPLTFIGFYSGIYKLLDMSYTTLNVTGDISANLIINKYSKKE